MYSPPLNREWRYADQNLQYRPGPKESGWAIGMVWTADPRVYENNGVSLLMFLQTFSNGVDK